MVRFLVGLQGGYTKFPCFICLWDSRAREQHWRQKEWPMREQMVPGENIQAQPLVERSKIVFPPLHIKLRVMKQFVKALNKDGACFKYICSKCNCNCNYILFTKLPWPGDSEGTFRSSSQAATCSSVYHTRWRLHIVPLIAERQAGKL